MKKFKELKEGEQFSFANDPEQKIFTMIEVNDQRRVYSAGVQLQPVGIDATDNMPFMFRYVTVVNSFEHAAKPLIDYLAANHHPHTKVIVTSDSAELVEGYKMYRPSIIKISKEPDSGIRSLNIVNGVSVPLKSTLDQLEEIITKRREIMKQDTVKYQEALLESCIILQELNKLKTSHG